MPVFIQCNKFKLSIVMPRTPAEVGPSPHLTPRNGEGVCECFAKSPFWVAVLSAGEARPLPPSVRRPAGCELGQLQGP